VREKKPSHPEKDQRRMSKEDSPEVRDPERKLSKTITLPNRTRENLMDLYKRGLCRGEAYTISRFLIHYKNGA